MGLAENMVLTESTKIVSRSAVHQQQQHQPVGNNGGGGGGGLGLPKYKPRKVSCVRDFPLGCGPNAAAQKSPSPRPNEQAASLAPGGVEEKRVGDYSINDGTREVEQRNGVGNVGARLDVWSDEANVLDPVDLKVSGMPMSGARKPLGVFEAIEPVKTFGNEMGNVRKNVSVAGATTSKPKYAAWRPVSAVRDFPRLCGPNALRLVNGEDHGVKERAVRQMVKTGMKRRFDDVQDEDNRKRSMLEANLKGLNSNQVRAETEGRPSKKRGNENEFGASFEIGMEMQQVDTKEKGIKPPPVSIQNWHDQKSEAAPSSGNKSYVGSGKSFEKDITVHTECKSLTRELAHLPHCGNQISEDDSENLELISHRPVVQPLMASQNCPWRQEKATGKNLAGGRYETKVKNNSPMLVPKSSSVKKKKAVKNSGKKHKTNSAGSIKIHEVIGQIVAYDKDDYIEDGGEFGNFHLVRRSRDFDVSLLPFVPSNSSGRGYGNDSIVMRRKVRETLRLFQAVCRKILQGEESKLKERGNGVKRIDLLASKIIKKKGLYVNHGKKIVGSTPGVEVGDEFQYKVELLIVGLHHQIQGGIDFMKVDGEIIATSIVSSGGYYDDDTESSDILIYTGQGGNVTDGGKEPEDQKLERGNLALKNSMNKQNPVRVIRGDTKPSYSSDARSKMYVYDGLYLVDKFWHEIGPRGKLVFKFKMVRIPGQPEMAWKIVRKSRRFNVREGICVDDISGGREVIPISAVNTIDNEKPPPFTYICCMKYPDWCRPIPPCGCDCVSGCSESKYCSCVAKNGEIPYNRNGAIVEVKSLVYECGPSCKCPPSCYNRVSQHGIKFQLEIFKTESRGWGVRSLNSIPSGSFVCEYVGELLEEKEAEQRAGNDEYLFDIGNSYDDASLRDGLSTLMPEVQSSSHDAPEASGFTIDAAQYGNVGRFINHSCSPNLYAQNVLYDHHDKRIPQIMFFAAENIPPLKELTYHYNYMIDQVFDADGNVKKKSCYCGSSECTGRMY